MLDRFLSLFTKAENESRPGPWLTSAGILPASWGSFMNWWQMGYNPIVTGPNATVEACIWAYIRAIAQLPGYHRRDDEDGGQETITTSAFSRLLKSPNDYETPSDFLVHLIRSLLLTGNSYWPCERNARNEVIALHWTNPQQVTINTVAVDGQAEKEVFYVVGATPLLNIDNRDQLVVPKRDCLHIKLDTPLDPLKGVPWLSGLSCELANRGAVQAAISSFYANASRPSGIISTDQKISQEQIDELRNRWNRQSQGLNVGGVSILTQGYKWQAAQMSAVDAQLIETLKINDRTIAAMFGVPAELVGITEGAAPARSTEAIMNQWLASGLGFLINHIEQAFDKFIDLPADEYTEFDTRALLRSLFSERIDGLVKGVQGGIFSPNEARRLEGYPDVEFGDEPRVQQQVVPLSFASEPPLPPAQTPPAPPAPDAPPSAEPAEAGGKALMASYAVAKRFVDEHRPAA